MKTETQGVIFHLPFPPSISSPSFLLSRSLPLVLQMSQSLFLISPLPQPSSRVKHHYIITQGWITVMVVCEPRERLGLGGGQGWQGSSWQTKGKVTTLNGFCAPINEEYLILIVTWIRIPRLFFWFCHFVSFLCGNVTFPLVTGRVWVRARCHVCVSSVAPEHTLLFNLICRGFSRNRCVVRNFPVPLCIFLP